MFIFDLLVYSTFAGFYTIKVAFEDGKGMCNSLQCELLVHSGSKWSEWNKDMVKFFLIYFLYFYLFYFFKYFFFLSICFKFII